MFRNKTPITEMPISQELAEWQNEQLQREMGHGLVPLKGLGLLILSFVAIGLLDNGIRALQERHAKKAAAKAGTSYNMAAQTQAFDATKTVSFHAAAKKMMNKSL